MPTSDGTPARPVPTRHEAVPVVTGAGVSGPPSAVPVGPADRRGGRRWLGLLFISLGVSLIIMDATIVNVSLPVVIRDLHLSAAGAEWVNSVYPLVFASLLIALGRIGDLAGRRRLFLAGLTVFGLASVVAATADSGTVLVLGRALQGVGGAMVLPATLATLNATFSGRDRNIAFAVWGSTIGGMAAVGPLVGGWLTTDVSWRWAFLINIPVVAVAVIGGLRYIDETTDPHAGRGVDVVGVLTSMVGLGALVFGLIEGQRYGWWRSTDPLTLGGWHWPWTVSPIPVAFAVSLVVVVAFVLVERFRRRAGRAVLLDVDLFRIRSFRYGSIAALIVALGEFGILFALPLFLQGALGYSALRTGVLIVAVAVGTFASSAMTPQISQRYGRRAVVRIGLALEVVAVAGLGATVGPHVAAWTLTGWLTCYGVGVGMATAQLTSVIMADVPLAESGQASGTQSTVRQVGSALGIALLGTMLVVTLGTRTRAELDTVPGLTATQRDAVAATVRGSAGAAIPALRSRPGGAAAGDAAIRALSAATRDVAVTAAGVLIIGLLATLALPRVRREDELAPGPGPLPVRNRVAPDGSG